MTNIRLRKTALFGCPHGFVQKPAGAQLPDGGAPSRPGASALKKHDIIA